MPSPTATPEPQSGYLVGTDNPTPEQKALLRKLGEELGGRHPAAEAQKTDDGHRES
jgi:hypothetical protein